MYEYRISYLLPSEGEAEYGCIVDFVLCIVPCGLVVSVLFETDEAPQILFLTAYWKKLYFMFGCVECVSSNFNPRAVHSHWLS